jgi:hypothetical protein
MKQPPKNQQFIKGQKQFFDILGTAHEGSIIPTPYPSVLFFWEPLVKRP